MKIVIPERGISSVNEMDFISMIMGWNLMDIFQPVIVKFEAREGT